MLVLEGVPLSFDEQRMQTRASGLVIEFSDRFSKASGFGLRDVILSFVLDHRARRLEELQRNTNASVTFQDSNGFART